MAVLMRVVKSFRAPLAEVLVMRGAPEKVFARLGVRTPAKPSRFLFVVSIRFGSHTAQQAVAGRWHHNRRPPDSSAELAGSFLDGLELTPLARRAEELCNKLEMLNHCPEQSKTLNGVMITVSCHQSKAEVDFHARRTGDPRRVGSALPKLGGVID